MLKKLADRLEFEFYLLSLRIRLCRELSRWLTDVYEAEFPPDSLSFTVFDFYRGNTLAEINLNAYYREYS